MNSHKLSIENHSHIIGRQDGVTGDSIKANDEIVFCAACQSVFLKESWEYMNEKHCNQSETLDFVPARPTTFFAKKREKFVFEFSDDSSTETVQVIITTILGAVLLVTFSKLFKETAFYIHTLSALALAILGGFLAKTKSFKEAFGANHSKVKITENGIELKGEDFYSFQEINTLEYVKTIGSVHSRERSLIDKNRITADNSLYIVRENKLTIQHKLPQKTYLETEKFLFALANSAQFVEVNFHTEHKKEKEVIKTIESKYKGKIRILKFPTRYPF